MSHWCPDHIDYEAKGVPRSECARCWKLYEYKNPEVKHDMNRIIDDMMHERIDQ